MARWSIRFIFMGRGGYLAGPRQREALTESPMEMRVVADRVDGSVVRSRSRTHLVVRPTSPNPTMCA